MGCTVGTGLDEWQLHLGVGGCSYKPVLRVLVQPGMDLGTRETGNCLHNSGLLLTNESLVWLVSWTHSWQGGVLVFLRSALWWWEPVRVLQ